jgi:hypothetical protein
VLETIGPWQYAGRYHPRLAVGAARPVDRQQLWIGFLHPGHEAKNSAIPKTCLSAPRPNYRIFGCENGDASLGGSSHQAGRLCPDKGRRAGHTEGVATAGVGAQARQPALAATASGKFIACS